MKASYPAPTSFNFVGSGLADGVLRALSPAQLAIVETVLYNQLLTQQIDLSQIAPARLIRRKDLITEFSESIDEIRQTLAEKVREDGSTLTTVGTIALCAGAAFASAPLAAIGAAATVVGLGIGLSNGLILDNAQAIADSGKSEVSETVKYFASYVAGSLLSAPSPFAQQAGQASPKIRDFLLDQAYGMAVDSVARHLIDGTSDLWRSVIRESADYLRQDTTPTTFPSYNHRWSGTGSGPNISNPRNGFWRGQITGESWIQGGSGCQFVAQPASEFALVTSSDGSVIDLWDSSATILAYRLIRQGNSNSYVGQENASYGREFTPHPGVQISGTFSELQADLSGVVTNDGCGVASIRLSLMFLRSF